MVNAESKRTQRTDRSYSEKMCLQVTTDLTAVLKSHTNLNDENADSISYVLSELMDNVFHHADSPINAIVCADAFRDRKEVELAIVDCGMGFKKSLGKTKDLGKNSVVREKLLN